MTGVAGAPHAHMAHAGVFTALKPASWQTPGYAFAISRVSTMQRSKHGMRECAGSTICQSAQMRKTTWSPLHRKDSSNMNGEAQAGMGVLAEVEAAAGAGTPTIKASAIRRPHMALRRMDSALRSTA